MENEREVMEIDLLRLLKALWRKAWAVLLAAVLSGGIFLGVTLGVVTPMYSAEALMYVNSSNISVGGTKLSISQSELTAAQSLVDTYIVILNTRSTLEEVIRQTKVSYTYEELKEMITAEAVNATEIFRIVVTGADPEEAELLANTIAQVLPSQIASIVEGSSARIVDYAVTPVDRSSPNLLRISLIGVFLGAVAACAAVIVQELSDDLIHDSDYLHQTYDIPVLAVIPDLLSAKSDDPYHRSGEARSRTER